MKFRSALLLVVLSVQTGLAQSPKPGVSGSTMGDITGRVTDGDTGDPLPFVNVAILGTDRGASSGTNGEFAIRAVPFGTYTLRFTYLGYSEKRTEVTVDGASTTALTVVLIPEPLSFKEVVVTPGVFSIMGAGPTVRQSLTREDLETVPFGEDVYRALNRLPGISGSDFSAKFNIRGGENDEVLVQFDGLELYDPFHLKDIEGGALSIIDVAAVEGIDLMTGGFTSEYGGRMSGVFNMRSVKPAGETQTSVGLSLMNVRAGSQGVFDGTKGQWFVSARRGYLDLVLDLMGEEDPPRPTYYDVLGKVSYQIHPKHRLGVNLLFAQDFLEYVEDDDDEDQTSYRNGYVWATLNSVPSGRLFIQTLASYGNVQHRRDGTAYRGFDRSIDFIVTDRQEFDVVGLKQDWTFDVSDRWLLKWGADLKVYEATYDYFSTKRRYVSLDPVVTTIDTNAVYTGPSGSTFGAYVSTRFQPIAALTVEPGVRFDRSAFTGDELVSPRLNAAYALGRQTFVRAGWGYFYQSERINEIRVGEGERDFNEAQLAKHWVAGIDHTFRNGYNVRVEGYFKDESRLRPDYRNFSNTLEIFPELQDDRFKVNFNGGTSKGVETYFKYDRGGKWTWWSSYAFAYADDDIRSVEFQGVEYTEGAGEYPGKSDQRHTVSLDVNYRPDRDWRFNATWHFRSGWPYTPLELMTEADSEGGTRYFVAYGDFQSERYPAYHRLDLSANRYFRTSSGTVSLFVSLINVYNHGNVRNIEYDFSVNPRAGPPVLRETPEYWFKLLPSVGVTWSLDH